ncbi:hypothetical protein H4Q26_012146 [Puccinia striiformis f. sp. tritici PST-130]|nr:hypothetical protein H4Q26_012146 [Puccinia striiformis f. sp. tritici PST-130]
MASFIRAYNSSLLHRPLRTQIVTSLILFGGGDVIAQQAIERKGKQHEWARTARLAGYGGFVFAPLGTPTLLKLSIDQIIAAPTMLAFFFYTMNFLEGNDLKQGEERLREKWGLPYTKIGSVIFIPLQAINFGVVPSHLRLLVINGASLFWNSYLSYANATDIPIVGKLIEQADQKFVAP